MDDLDNLFRMLEAGCTFSIGETRYEGPSKLDPEFSALLSDIQAAPATATSLQHVPKLLDAVANYESELSAARASAKALAAIAHAAPVQLSSQVLQQQQHQHLKILLRALLVRDDCLAHFICDTLRAMTAKEVSCSKLVLEALSQPENHTILLQHLQQFGNRSLAVGLAMRIWPSPHGIHELLLNLDELLFNSPSRIASAAAAALQDAAQTAAGQAQVIPHCGRMLKLLQHNADRTGSLPVVQRLAIILLQLSHSSEGAIAIAQEVDGLWEAIRQLGSSPTLGVSECANTLTLMILPLFGHRAAVEIITCEEKLPSLIDIILQTNKVLWQKEGAQYAYPSCLAARALADVATKPAAYPLLVEPRRLHVLLQGLKVNNSSVHKAMWDMLAALSEAAAAIQQLPPYADMLRHGFSLLDPKTPPQIVIRLMRCLIPLASFGEGQLWLAQCRSQLAAAVVSVTAMPDVAVELPELSTKLKDMLSSVDAVLQGLKQERQQVLGAMQLAMVQFAKAMRCYQTTSANSAEQAVAAEKQASATATVLTALDELSQVLEKLGRLEEQMARLGLTGANIQA